MWKLLILLFVLFIFNYPITAQLNITTTTPSTNITHNNSETFDYVDNSSSSTAVNYETPLPAKYGHISTNYPETTSKVVSDLNESTTSSTSPDIDNSNASEIDENNGLLMDQDYEPSPPEDGLPRYAPNLNHTIQLLSNLAKVVDQSIHTLINEAVPHVSEFGYRFPLSENCILSLMQLLNAFKKQKAWAFRCKLKITFNYDDNYLSSSSFYFLPSA